LASGSEGSRLGDTDRPRLSACFPVPCAEGVATGVFPASLAPFACSFISIFSASFAFSFTSSACKLSGLFPLPAFLALTTPAGVSGGAPEGVHGDGTDVVPLGVAGAASAASDSAALEDRRVDFPCTGLAALAPEGALPSDMARAASAASDSAFFEDRFGVVTSDLAFAALPLDLGGVPLAASDSTFFEDRFGVVGSGLAFAALPLGLGGAPLAASGSTFFEDRFGDVGSGLALPAPGLALPFGLGAPDSTVFEDRRVGFVGPGLTLIPEGVDIVGASASMSSTSGSATLHARAVAFSQRKRSCWSQESAGGSAGGAVLAFARRGLFAFEGGERRRALALVPDSAEGAGEGDRRRLRGP